MGVHQEVRFEIGQECDIVTFWTKSYIFFTIHAFDIIQRGVEKGRKALHHDYSCELPLFWTTHSKWFKCLGDCILCSNRKKTIVWWHCLTHLPFTQCSIYSHEFSLDLILIYRGMIFFPLTRHQYICYIGMASLQYVSSLFKCNQLMFLDAQNFETHCYLFKVNWDASWPPNSYMCVVIMFIHRILILQLMPWPGVRGSKFQINWCNWSGRVIRSLSRPFSNYRSCFETLQRM